MYEPVSIVSHCPHESARLATLVGTAAANVAAEAMVRNKDGFMLVIELEIVRLVIQFEFP